MNIEKEDIIEKIRTAIDDIVPQAADSFTDDTDAELWQATWHAVQALLLELPLAMMTPSTFAPDNSGHTKNNDGSGDIVLPEGFLRFVSLKLSTWLRPVTELMETDSEEALSQTSKWGRGTPEKPRAMLDFNGDGSLILRYWTAGRNSNGEYDHTVSVLNYIPKAELVTDNPGGQASHQAPYINCALKDHTEWLVICRAASIFFEGKKESDIADKFKNIHTI